MARRLQQFSQGFPGRSLAMDQEGLSGWPAQPADPVDNLALVGVGGEPGQRSDPRLYGNLLPQNSDPPGAFQQPAPSHTKVNNR